MTGRPPGAATRLADAAVLSAVRANPGSSLRQLADLCGVDPHGIRRSVDRLAELGLVRLVRTLTRVRVEPQ